MRDGEALQRIGISAELFDDHSPLQLGSAGRHQGAAFTLVGRLQYRYADGTWNQWHALFDSGKSGWLSEDNGAYVIAFDAPLTGPAPAADELSAGERRLVQGSAWNVASVTRASLQAAQGELPRPPRLDGAEFTVADLRNEADEVGTLDWSEAQQPVWSVGRAVRLADLALSGLREDSEMTLGGRSLDCPSCGASLQLSLASTQSIVCGQCKAVVDVSQGAGTQLSHYAQNNSGHEGIGPAIPLGRTAPIALGGPELPWQVVGYVERCDLPAPGDDEEQSFWREYLLYNRQEGFTFIVDAEDGWSWMRPLTGAPQTRGDTATWKGRTFQQRYSYAAKVTWVLGEFYWRLKREERAQVTDYFGRNNAAGRRLSREEVGTEVTWSEGAGLDTAVLEGAFGLAAGGLPDMARAGGAAAAAPWSGLNISGGLIKTLLVVGFIVVALVLSETNSSSSCDELRTTFGDSSNEYQQCLSQSRGSGSGRTTGGSFGGFSSGGGGHK